MSGECKSLKNFFDERKINKLKVGNLNVEIIYSKDGKSLNECMLNILKQKAEKGR